MAQHIWSEKFRPSSIKDYIFQDSRHKSAVNKFLQEGEIPHLLLSGVCGSGKTTLSQILVTELGIDESDILIINASDENSVDNMRDKIKNFVVTYAMGSFKVVRLEEADFLSLNAQAVMRNLMEENESNARFILTCNYPHKIMPAIRSRCQEFNFKAADKLDITEYCVNILVSENIKFTIDLIDMYVAAGYPDVRKIVGMLQQNSINKTLLPPTSTASAGDWKFQLLDLMESDKWIDIRKLICANVLTEEWDDVYRFLYENIDKSKKFQDVSKWEEAILIIAKHLYQHSICSDPEINASAMFIGLQQL